MIYIWDNGNGHFVQEHRITPIQSDLSAAEVTALLRRLDIDGFMIGEVDESSVRWSGGGRIESLMDIISSGTFLEWRGLEPSAVSSEWLCLSPDLRQRLISYWDDAKARSGVKNVLWPLERRLLEGAL